MTQTAFWGGGLARKVEPDGRKPILLGAANLFLRTVDTAAFCVFAMGHTHQAILTEIVIEDQEEEVYVPEPYTD